MEAKDNVKRLTNTLVESAACPSGRPNVIVWDDKVKGLGVRINAAGTVRTYLLQYRVKGTRQERQIKIGRHNDPWRIDQARAKAMALKVEMLDGVDPVVRDQQKVEADRAAAVLTEAQTITLRQVMEHYVQHQRTRHGALRAASIRDIERHVTVNLADWADEPVASIKRDACIERFDAISESSPSQAAQCFANLRALLNHARDMFETDDGEYPLLAVNPVQRMFKKRKPKPEKPRDTRVPLDRVRAVWAMLEKRRAAARTVDDRTSADWVSFMLLTGTRKTESGSLLWSNVDFEAGTFHLPGDVVKNHNGITLPMSTPLRALLKSRRELPEPSEKVAERRRAERSSEYVFPSWGRLGYITDADATMQAVSEVAGTRVTIHDLRRTFVDVCAQVGVSADRERLLTNHISGDVHARHYANSKQALTADVEAIAKWITAEV
ncbi:tyrosine-type recombinase/integrase [Piscinibacter sp.]|uniref:tyrosine-type recombinase/integrase n=1 Tax=Piscinibacter sp. TaxID=1903157 RepID=UPI0039E29D38